MYIFMYPQHGDKCKVSVMYDGEDIYFLCTPQPGDKCNVSVMYDGEYVYFLSTHNMAISAK